MHDENKAVGTGFQSYEEAVEWIIGRISFGMKPGLKRMEQLMEMLDHPERRLKFIHVAGTNGKGSTCAFISEVLKQSGYGVGTFTSPYIEKYTSRIQFNGNHIEEAEMLRLCNQLKPLVDEIAASDLGPPTMFEVSTALAILYFAKVVVADYVVWETGLGGRLDSTNIVTPIVTVITNIGHDHMDILGDSLEKVAAEKAGIIKAGVPVISAVEQPEAIAVLERFCREKQSTLYLMGRQFQFTAVSSSLDQQWFDFRGPFRKIEGLSISLNGYHQYKNATVALMTLEVLRQYYALIIEDDIVLSALQETRWPGRLEMISTQPRILLDGAHNPESAEMLAHALQHTYQYKKLHVMIGMIGSKNHSGYLRHILPMVDTLIVTEPVFPKKMDAVKLAELAQVILHEISPGLVGRVIDMIVELDWKKALERLVRSAEPDDLAVVSGSLYLISDVRTWILHKSDSEKGW